MFTRPIYYNIGATTFCWQDISAATDSTPYGGAFRIMPMYQKSFHSRGAAAYFLVNCKPKIFIAGDASSIQIQETRDVRAEWLGLPATTSGFYSIHPQQKQFGLVGTYRQHLKIFSDISFFENSWIDATMAFVEVENELKPTQSNVQGLLTGQSFIETFNKPSFEFAKISPCKLKDHGLGQITLSLGTTWEKENDFLLSYYTGLIIPGSGKHSPKYLFSPVVGTDRHFGWTAGLLTKLPLHDEDSCYKLHLLFAAENNYLFHNHEFRTLDLYKKPWSRYLQLRKKDNPDTVPALNIFTQRVKVHPRSFFNLATGLSSSINNFQATFGYQMWASSSECLRFAGNCCVPQAPEIESYGIAGTGTETASKSTITTLAPNDTDCNGNPKFVHLHRNDLDLRSGSGRGAFSQALLIAVGWMSETSFATIGGSYEQPHKNTALPQWTIWLNAGCNF